MNAHDVCTTGTVSVTDYYSPLPFKDAALCCMSTILLCALPCVIAAILALLPARPVLGAAAVEPARVYLGCRYASGTQG